MHDHDQLHSNYPYALHRTKFIDSIQEGSENGDVQKHVQTEVQPLSTPAGLNERGQLKSSLEGGGYKWAILVFLQLV